LYFFISPSTKELQNLKDSQFLHLRKEIEQAKKEQEAEEILIKKAIAFC